MSADRDQAAIDYLHQQVLQAGEEVTWMGRPNPPSAATLELKQAGMALAMVAFGGFFFFGQSAALGGVGWFAYLFIGAAAWPLSGPILNYWRATRAYYAITTQRVLILIAGTSFKTTSIAPSQINQYERSDGSGGRGNIRLTKTEKRARYGWYHTVEFSDGLWGIEDVRAAADAIADLRTQK